MWPLGLLFRRDNSSVRMCELSWIACCRIECQPASAAGEWEKEKKSTEGLSIDFSLLISSISNEVLLVEAVLASLNGLATYNVVFDSGGGGTSVCLFPPEKQSQ